MTRKRIRLHLRLTDFQLMQLYFMKNIRAKDTKIEVVLRRALWKKGYRYRKNYGGLPGNPDIVLTKYKIAIFCDGEFFYGKDWEVLKPRLEKKQQQ